MPNWCANHATFTAVTDEAKKLLSDYRNHLSNSESKSSKFFNFFLPIPQDLQDTASGTMSGKEGELLKKKQQENIAKHGFDSWYDFAIARWGTKWDVDLDASCIVDDKILMDAETAWGPPIEFYRHMESLGFEVEASYHEEGAGFYGSYSDGYDNSNDIPSLSGVAEILRDHYTESNYSYQINEIDFDTIKTGDVLTTETGETFIYVSHQLFTPQDILEENPEIEDENLWDIDDSFRAIAELDTDVYLVNVSVDQTKPGTQSGIVFADEKTKISFSQF
jgi:hypothetical protein